MQHTHQVKYWPKTTDGHGWGVCDCGATIRIERGAPVGPWHSCTHCTPKGAA